MGSRTDARRAPHPRASTLNDGAFVVVRRERSAPKRRVALRASSRRRFTQLTDDRMDVTSVGQNLGQTPGNRNVVLADVETGGNLPSVQTTRHLTLVKHQPSPHPRPSTGTNTRILLIPPENAERLVPKVLSYEYRA